MNWDEEIERIARQELQREGFDETHCSVQCIKRYVMTSDSGTFHHRRINDNMIRDAQVFVCETHHVIHRCNKEGLCGNQVSDSTGNMCCLFSGIPCKYPEYVYGFERVDARNREEKERGVEDDEKEDWFKPEKFGPRMPDLGPSKDALAVRRNRQERMRTREDKIKRANHAAGNERKVRTINQHGRNVMGRPLGDNARMTMRAEDVREFVSVLVHMLFLDAKKRGEVAEKVLESVLRVRDQVQTIAEREVRGEGEIVSNGVLYPVRGGNVLMEWSVRTKKSHLTQYLASAAYTRQTRVFDFEMARILVSLLCEMWPSIDVMMNPPPTPNMRSVGEFALAVIYLLANNGVRKPQGEYVSDEWVRLHAPPIKFVHFFSSDVKSVRRFKLSQKAITTGVNEIRTQTEVIVKDEHVRTMSVMETALNEFVRRRDELIRAHTTSDGGLKMAVFVRGEVPETRRWGVEKYRVLPIVSAEGATAMGDRSDATRGSEPPLTALRMAARTKRAMSDGGRVKRVRAVDECTGDQFACECTDCVNDRKVRIGVVQTDMNECTGWKFSCGCPKCRGLRKKRRITLSRNGKDSGAGGSLQEDAGHADLASSAPTLTTPLRGPSSEESQESVDATSDDVWDGGPYNEQRAPKKETRAALVLRRLLGKHKEDSDDGEPFG